MNNKANFCALILAGGVGLRAKTKQPKQYTYLNNKMILEYSLETFIESKIFSKIILVINSEHQKLYLKNIQKDVTFIESGKTRQESSYNGLKALLSTNPDYVYIHDAARPFISLQKLLELKKKVTPTQAAILALPVQDTVKQVDNNFIEKTLNRENLFLAQTPQVFPYKPILNAHEIAKNNIFTDDSQVAESAGISIKIIEGEAENLKITTNTDFLLAELILKNIRNI